MIEVAIGYFIMACVWLLMITFGRENSTPDRRVKSRREARRIRNRNYMLAQRHKISLRRENECAW